MKKFFWNLFAILVAFALMFCCTTALSGCCKDKPATLTTTIIGQDGTIVKSKTHLYAITDEDGETKFVSKEYIDALGSNDYSEFIEW